MNLTETLKFYQSEKIGYCLMIEGSCNDFSTVYTVLKNAQMVIQVSEHHDAVITFDVAFCFQAKQIQI